MREGLGRRGIQGKSYLVKSGLNKGLTPAFIDERTVGIEKNVNSLALQPTDNFRKLAVEQRLADSVQYHLRHRLELRNQELNLRQTQSRRLFDLAVSNGAS